MSLQSDRISVGIIVSVDQGAAHMSANSGKSAVKIGRGSMFWAGGACEGANAEEGDAASWACC